MSQSPVGARWSRDYRLITLHRGVDPSNRVNEEHRYLAPDRWSPSGWKYVQTEAVSSPYLTHANKRNAYPQRRQPDSPTYSQHQFQTSNRLHYQRLTPDLYVKTEESEDREEFPPLPVAGERASRALQRLSRREKARLQGLMGYHETCDSGGMKSALDAYHSPSPQSHHYWAGHCLSPAFKHFHKRKTVLTEWQEQSLARRQKPS